MDRAREREKERRAGSEFLKMIITKYLINFTSLSWTHVCFLDNWEISQRTLSFFPSFYLCAATFLHINSHICLHRRLFLLDDLQLKEVCRDGGFGSKEKKKEKKRTRKIN
jgi:hypothetical protein